MVLPKEAPLAVKLVDLQMIYRVAGAREKFEDLASQLVEGEQPDADKVRIEKGDSGIDLHVGDLSDAEGIDVYYTGMKETHKGFPVE